MSERLDNQKRQSRNLRKVLQERIEKANPRRKVTAKDAKRLNKLEAIAGKLWRGENVQNRQLQTWLTEDEYALIDVEWHEQLELRDEIKNKTSELRLYEEKLRQATFNYNRAEGYSSKGKHQTARKFHNKSESLCEDALEILQEITHADPQLQIWFDINLDFVAGSDTSANAASLPRLVTSRSIERQRDDCRIVKKIDVKMSVVERAIQGIWRE